MPAGVPVDVEQINEDLRRRQGGYGRGGRMQIERDRIEILSGVRHGETLGSPIALLLWNKDWENWKGVMGVEPPEGEVSRQVRAPRPGHADLSGVLKYARQDARDILERASARETAARTAVAGVAKALLRAVGISVQSHVVMIGGVRAPGWEELRLTKGVSLEEIGRRADASEVRCLTPEVEGEMKAAIDRAREAGDTVGGVFEIVATGVPVGLGSHVQWDRRLDGRLGQALLSIQAIKGVEIGVGFACGELPGSQVHDEIKYEGLGDDFLEGFPPLTGPGALCGGFRRQTNRAGGLEGGMTDGGDLVVRAVMKPLSTLMTPKKTIDLRTGREEKAVTERSDVSAVPAASIVGEAMVSWVLAQAFLEKFGGDSLVEVLANYRAYLQRLAEYVRQEF